MADTTTPDEAVGLQGALDYTAAGSKSAATEKGKVEAAVALMTDGKVGEACTAYGPRVMEKYGELEALFDEWNKHLDQMTRVRESYEATPDAGEKEWLLNGR
ncbi:hypothetical protein ACFQXA_38795 [Nocardiopsis composta]